VSNFAGDMVVKHAHGLTLTQWNNLSDRERAVLRDTVTQAPHFQETNQ
jgi:hypothetical protein